MIETRWAKVLPLNNSGKRGDFAATIEDDFGKAGKIVIMRLGALDSLYGVTYAAENGLPMFVLVTVTTDTEQVSFGHVTPLVTRRNGGVQVVGLSGYEAKTLQEARKQHTQRLRELRAETLEIETLPLCQRQPQRQRELLKPKPKKNQRPRRDDSEDFVEAVNKRAEQPRELTNQEVNLPEALADLLDEETMLVEMAIVEDEYGPLGVDLVIAMRDHDWSQPPSEHLLAKFKSLQGEAADAGELWNRYAPSVFVLS